MSGGSDPTNATDTPQVKTLSAPNGRLADGVVGGTCCCHTCCSALYTGFPPISWSGENWSCIAETPASKILASMSCTSSFLTLPCSSQTYEARIYRRLDLSGPGRERARQHQSQPLKEAGVSDSGQRVCEGVGGFGFLDSHPKHRELGTFGIRHAQDVAGADLWQSRGPNGTAINARTPVGRENASGNLLACFAWIFTCRQPW